LEPGHPPIPTDRHAHDQTMFVFSGSVQLILNGTDRYVVNPGECLPLVEHQLAKEALPAGGASG
jgi:mannose-6-phosphate isomerase-like protein (cupin superfamily)